MKLVGLKIDTLHLLVGDFATGWIFSAIQSACRFESFRCRRLSDEFDDGFVVTKRFSAPIRGDEGKEAVFNLVPFAGPGWKMTDRNGKACFIREALQLQLPKAQPPAIASASVRSDQYRCGIHMELFSLMAPPPPDGGHGKRSGVVIGSDIDETGVAPDVVNAIGIGTRNVGSGKVVTTNLLGLFRWKPLLASVVVVADEFFFLGIHRYDRTSSRPGIFSLRR